MAALSQEARNINASSKSSETMKAKPNATDAKLHKLADQYLSLKSRIRDLTNEAKEIRAEITRTMDLGKFEGITFYAVSGTHVKAHRRQNYNALHANLPKP